MSKEQITERAREFLSKQRPEIVYTPDRYEDMAAFALAETRRLREDVEGWRPIATAPKDGRAILLLSIPYDAEMGSEIIHFPAKAAIGRWDPKGNSWVSTGLRADKEMYELQPTGDWSSGGGWFQPDEVSHWATIPPLEAFRELEKAK